MPVHGAPVHARLCLPAAQAGAQLVGTVLDELHGRERKNFTAASLWSGRCWVHLLLILFQKVQKLTCIVGQIGQLVNFALSLIQATIPNSMPSTWTGGSQGGALGQGHSAQSLPWRSAVSCEL